MKVMKTLFVAAVVALIATSASAQAHPRNWNSWNADQQATWNRLAPKAWREMTAPEQAEWTALLQPPSPSVVTVGQLQGYTHPPNWNIMTANQQDIWTRLGPKTWLDMTPVEQGEWNSLASIDAPGVNSQPMWYAPEGPNVVMPAENVPEPARMSKKAKWILGLAAIGAVATVATVCAKSDAGCVAPAPTSQLPYRASAVGVSGVNYSVSVKRLDKDVYQDTNSRSIIVTRYCYEYAYGDDAVLTPSKLIFTASGAVCDVHTVNGRLSW